MPLKSQVFEDTQITFEKGLFHFKAEEFEEALEIFERVKKIRPTTLVSFYLGLVYKQTGDLQKAKDSFIEAITGVPKVYDAYIELINIHYNLNELEEAKKRLKEADALGIYPARVSFLKGLIHAKEGDFIKAREAFQKAKELDKALTDACDLQIALTYVQERKFVEAERAFKSLLETTKQTALSEFIKDYLNNLSRLAKVFRPYSFNLVLGSHYDSNVVSKPNEKIGLAVVDEITQKADWLYSLNFRAKYHPLLSGRFSFNSELSVFAKRYNKLKTYNSESISLSVTPGFNLSKYTLTMPLELSLNWFKKQRDSATIGLRPSFMYKISESSIIQLGTGITIKDKLRYIDNADPEEDSDGTLYDINLAYHHIFREGLGLFTFRYDVVKDYTEGKNLRNLSHKINTLVIYPIVERFSLIGSFEFIKQVFEHIHNLSGKEIPGFSPTRPTRRKDEIINFGAGINFNLYNSVRLNFLFNSIYNKSNLKIYEYKKKTYNFELNINF